LTLGNKAFFVALLRENLAHHFFANTCVMKLLSADMQKKVLRCDVSFLCLKIYDVRQLQY